ncbi:hypothetical protein [Wenzhouxiangella marina]|uniref:Uncharacterized protein n=1 Tax=Wenzhouxiangella marina TaxID=1579979 RepID=A0A0K0XU10_9GAMM|nr:hypothetical protein [Wenzhouxiangella marina]AKS41112.1 hypothetical protein WM2015_731 [Wenzhouxiangella marina]MBB6087991.1 hypothetical protein [Wenzhouxiangella marina]
MTIKSDFSTGLPKRFGSLLVLILLSMSAGAATPALTGADWLDPSASQTGSSGAALFPYAGSEQDACELLMEQFARGVGDLMLAMDKLPDSLVEIGWEASQRMQSTAREQAALLCQGLDDPEALRTNFTQLAQSFAANGRARGCIENETYLAISGVRSILLVIGVAIQAYCDGTSCPSPFETVTPQCGIACPLVIPFNISAEVISTRMDIADKCTDLEHEEVMANLRRNTRASVSGLGRFVLNALERARSAADNGGDDEAARQTANQIEDAFGNLEARSSDAIGPSLRQLQEAVASGQATQQQFEREALQSRLETALGTGVTLSRMLRPRAFDGVLEDVRELVARRIQAVQASGGDVDDALVEFRAGDDAFNESDYRLALRHYRSAYIALIPGPYRVRGEAS